MATTQVEPSFRRAVVLMTLTSFLVPAAGLVTAPLLARALSADGRGQLAAALAPAGLTLAAATLGLPDALTFYLAKRPDTTRWILAWASLITFGLGIVCVLVVLLVLPFLRDGDVGLGHLILLATILTVPALVVGVFRGAATGRQMWRAVAAERVINTVARVGAIAVLFVVGHLTVLSAVVVSSVTPLISGVVYAGLLRRSRSLTGPEDGVPGFDPEALGAVDAAAADGLGDVEMSRILSFGSKVWFGSVASMMLSRAAPVLMAPLSDVRDLGLYTVASTISDLPLIVALAIQGALFGVNAKSADARQVTRTSRLTILAATTGCAVVGVTLPLWIGLLFGSDFTSATVPTLMLMGSAILCIPGLMAATGLSAWGRPGLRSAGLGITLVVNVAIFVLLVPPFGVIGACWTSIIGNVVMTTFMVGGCRRVMGVPARDFLVVRRSDVRYAFGEARRIALRVKPVRGRV